MILLFSALGSKAQYCLAGTPGIFYTDIVPDTFLNTVNWQTEDYVIDLNQDGTQDLKIHSYNSVSPGSTNMSLEVYSLNASTKLLLGSVDSLYHTFFNSWYTWNMFKKYNSMDTISDTNLVSSAYLAYWWFSAGSGKNNGTWINAGDKYFGVRYADGNDTLFGWVKVNITGQTNCYVKEFSLGGQINGILSRPYSEFNLFPNPAATSVQVDCPRMLEIKLFDIMGKEMLSTKEQTMDVSKLRGGIYFVQVKTPEGTLTKKIIVQR